MWLYQDDLANGINGLPKISKTSQAKIRKNKLLKYIVVDRHVVYKKEWIEDYLNSNIREAITKQEQINENNRA